MQYNVDVSVNVLLDGNVIPGVEVMANIVVRHLGLPLFDGPAVLMAPETLFLPRSN